MLLLLMIIAVVMCWKTSWLKPLRKQLWRPLSPAFPYLNKGIVGRSHDISLIMEWIDFSNEDIFIVNIVGPPGIGKSALAIKVGDEVIANGVRVFYINMEEIQERQKQVVSSKILSLSQYDSKQLTNPFEHLRHWANARWLNIIILLDNCENSVQKQRDELYEVIEELLKYSDKKIKIITTSRSTLMHLENYKTHKVGPLNEKAACLLLENRVPHLLNLTEKRAIEDLTGEVPLALQIIGALLNNGVNPPTPSEIIAS